MNPGDFVERFGVPLSRVVQDPPPGTATEQDVIDLDDHQDRLCELVDGTLMEKTTGTYESYLASYLGRLLSTYVHQQDLGIILGADGMVRLAPGVVRIPDCSFIAWDRLPGRRVPREPIAGIAPNLVVEVISESNTRQEMERKLRDYFAAGVRLVWYVYHTPRSEVRVYVGPDSFSVVREGEMLDGGAVLPGFQLAVSELFSR